MGTCRPRGVALVPSPCPIVGRPRPQPTGQHQPTTS
jgi:hypothetical protein